MMSYEEFLAQKALISVPTGISDPSTLSARLKEHQTLLTRWALRRGRAAVFADTGLGKGWITMEWSRVVADHVRMPVLILAPLAVSQQFERESFKLGDSITVASSQSDVGSDGVYVTNYHKLHKFDPDAFGGVALDESSILKSLDGKTRRLLIDAFRETPFRLSATATPSPNDHTELGGQAEFLGIMTHAEMLATFFVRDGGSTQDWRLKGHAREAFWRWCCSWGAIVKYPADIGCSNDGYELPPLNYHEHVIPASREDIHASGMLFAKLAEGLTEQRDARRSTIPSRCAMAAKIANESSGQVIVWCVPAGEPVVMSDGTEIPIDQIKIGSSVLSGSGIARSVSSVVSRQYDGDLIALKVRGIHRPVLTTPEHRVRIASGWKRADQVAVGDRLVEPRLRMASSGNYDEGWLVGHYAAQGSRTRGPRGTWNLCIFVVHEDKRDLLVRKLTSAYGKMPGFRTHANSKALGVDMSDVRLRTLIDEWVIGDQAPVKRLSRIPTERHFARGLLDGWLAGDGWSDKSGQTGQTSSPNLARQMAIIASALGFAVTMCTGKNRPGPAARAAGDFDRPVHDWFRVRVSDVGNHYAKPLIETDRVLREVTSVSRRAHTGPVFDLVVDVDHTFLVSGVVISNCDLNAESEYLRDAIGGSVEVTGSQDDDEKERRIADFVSGRARVLVSKPTICGWGLNLQFVRTVVFCGITHSWESFYQAIRRCWRFGVDGSVDVHIISSELEGNVVKSLREKQRKADELSGETREHVSAYLRSSILAATRETLAYEPTRTMTIPPWLVSEAEVQEQA